MMKLATGNIIPPVGLGTWQASGDKLEEVLRAAIDIGYRHIDTASIYENEAQVGKILKECFNSKKLQRKDFFITTKLWPTCYSPEEVPKALDDSLRKLQLEYVDLYLMHWPFALQRKEGLISKRNEKNQCLTEDIPLIDTWRAMEKLYKQGKSKAIGVSNFEISHLKQILDQCEIKPAVNQVECHPYLPQKELFQFCKENGIHVTAYSPLGSGRTPNLLEDETVRKISKEIGCTAAQVLINWQRARGLSVIPKTSKASRAAENFKQVSLSQSQITLLENLPIRKRFIDSKIWAGIPVFSE